MLNRRVIWNERDTSSGSLSKGPYKGEIAEKMGSREHSETRWTSTTTRSDLGGTRGSGEKRKFESQIPKWKSRRG